MYCIISMVLLALWAASGLERTDILVASIIFGALHIPENYITQKFKYAKDVRDAKTYLNSIFGTGSKSDDK